MLRGDPAQPPMPQGPPHPAPRVAWVAPPPPRPSRQRAAPCQTCCGPSPPPHLPGTDQQPRRSHPGRPPLRCGPWGGEPLGGPTWLQGQRRATGDSHRTYMRVQQGDSRVHLGVGVTAAQCISHTSATTPQHPPPTQRPLSTVTVIPHFTHSPPHPSPHLPPPVASPPSCALKHRHLRPAPGHLRRPAPHAIAGEQSAVESRAVPAALSHRRHRHSTRTRPRLGTPR